jgi:hypothetical protein
MCATDPPVFPRSRPRIKWALSRDTSAVRRFKLAGMDLGTSAPSVTATPPLRPRWRQASLQYRASLRRPASGRRHTAQVRIGLTEPDGSLNDRVSIFGCSLLGLVRLDFEHSDAPALSLFKAQLSSFRRNCVAGRQIKSRFELLAARWWRQIDRVGQRDGQPALTDPLEKMPVGPAERRRAHIVELGRLDEADPLPQLESS